MSAPQEQDDPYGQRRYTDYFYDDEETTASGNDAASSSSSASSLSSETPISSSSSSSSSSSDTSHSHAGPSTSRQGLDSERNSVPKPEKANRDTAAEVTSDINEEPLFGSSGRTSGADGSRYSAGRNERTQDDEEGQEEDVAEPEEDDDTDAFYALLNVAKDATEEQIRDAYRSLAVSLHPDKHTSPALKTAAENRFRAVQRAYEVLSDAEKRGVYDHFGTRGLTRDWALVRRSGNGGPRTAAEMREEWERLARQRKNEEMDNLVRSKGEFVINVDASTLLLAEERVPRGKDVIRQIGRAIVEQERLTGKPFQNGDSLDFEMPPVRFAERWARVGFTSLVGKHGWEVPLTAYNRLAINGSMLSKGGMGTGNVTTMLRTFWSSKFNTEATVSLMQPRAATLRGQYELTKYTFLSFMASGSTLLVPPHLQLSVGQKLSQKSSLTGFTAYNTGTYTLGGWGKGVKINHQPANMTLGVSNQYGQGKGWTCQVGLGVENQSVSLDYAFRPTFLGSPKARIGITLGLASGLNAYQMVDRKVTENVKLGVGVFFGIPMGNVTLQLRFARLGQKVIVPIQLSPHYRPDIVAACSIVPSLALLAAEHLYLRPAKKRKIQTRLVDLRVQHKDMIRQRRQGAREAIQVFRQNAFKRAHAERMSGGLVVVEAYYGKRSAWPALSDDVSADDLFIRVWGDTPRQGQDQAETTLADADSTTLSEAQEEELDQQAWCDVTVAVMMLVQRGQLVIPGGRQKHKLLGFYDPCMGERKHLVVRYLFRDRLHHVVVDDVTQLTAPLRSHTM